MRTRILIDRRPLSKYNREQRENIHGKKYDIAQPLALALTTERVEFLRMLSADKLKEEASIELIRDLIEDRIKLRAEVIKAVDALREIKKSMNAAYNKYQDLQSFVEGKDGNDEHGEYESDED